MNPFENLQATPPPYPAYKSYIVPRRIGDSISYVREFTQADVTKLVNVLSSLKNFLKGALKLASDTGAVEEHYEKIELIADMTAAFFKIPLIGDPIPHVAPSPAKAYPIARLFIRQLENILDNPITFTQTIYGHQQFEGFARAGLADIISNVTLADDIVSCWLDIPADTRPGMNSSGLIPHLLTTSSLVWCSLVEAGRGSDRGWAAEMRLAAILHDVGKPLNYRDHVQASVRVARALLDGLIDESVVNRVVELIQEHHRRGGIIHEADATASAIDRLSDLVTHLIGNELDSIALALGVERNVQSWEFWKAVYDGRERLKEAGIIREEPIKELSELFAKKISSMMQGYTMYPSDLDLMGADISYASLVLLDVRGVQEFIYSAEELRCLAAGSILVDTLVMSYLPILMQLQILKKHGVWIPYEAFILTSGGLVELLAPRSLENSIKDAAKEIGRRTAEQGLSISCISTGLSRSLRRTIEALAKISMESKNSPERLGAAITVRDTQGVRELCEICYSRPPEKRRSIHGEEKRICTRCDNLYDIGSNIHFREKYGKEVMLLEGLTIKPEDVLGVKWQEGEITASEYIIEIIAGHDGDELRKLLKGEVERRDVAVIKADGNLMGPFMATSLSLTDMMERSARIDIAMKRALRSAIYEAYKGVETAGGVEEAAKTAARIYLGILYVGGDDLLMLAPPWISPMLCMKLSREFSLELGTARGLSIGLISSPSIASVWSMIDAASELLGKAKKSCREEYRASRDANVLRRSYICFDNINTSFFSGMIVNSRHAALSQLGLSSQPYDITQDGGGFQELLSKITAGRSSEYVSAYLASRFSDSDEKELLKTMLACIGDAITASADMADRLGDKRYLNQITLVYSHRQAARLGEERTGRAYRMIIELIFMRPEGPLGTTLADAANLIKILGGGAL